MIMKIAIAVYGLVGVLALYGGVRYLTASEFMPYHEQALRADWSSLSAQQQGLILGLMKGRGAGAVAIGATIVLLAGIGLPRSSAIEIDVAAPNTVRLDRRSYSG